jgi:UPF0755 protein
LKRAVIIAGLFMIAVGAVLAGGMWWRQRQVQQFVDTPFGEPGEVVVAIPEHESVADLGRLLQEHGVISDAELFRRGARLLRADRALKAGEFGFDRPITPKRVIDIIAAGKVKLFPCTIAEGLRYDEVARAFEDCGLVKATDFMRRCRDRAFVHSLGVEADSLEGYLFPDTYLFPHGVKPEAILRKMVERFHDEYRKAAAQRKSGVNFNERDAVTAASIIEKETSAPEERPHISCVIQNRLRAGKRLEMDPTVIYALFLRDGSFGGKVHHDDLLMEHPYNTYKVTGLPPGPISNPGAASLRAALSPSDCDDFFYVSMNNGRHHFSRTWEEHLRYQQMYQPPVGKRAGG